MVQEAEDLPGYQRGEPIHGSSTSAVYRARRAADGACVVVKRSHGSTVSAHQLTRYRNEYELLRSLDSSGVVKAHDLVRHEGHVALILEDFAGSSLRRWIESAMDATIEQRLRIAVQLAATVADIHAANIIHKDITSHNVVYNRDTGVCKLIDFGIATRLRTEESKFQAPTALEGTLAYIAPEQTGRMNRSLDYRADLYSLGVTLYELFTGTVPHYSTDALELVHFHIAGRPVPPCERQPQVPRVLSDIVLKLLQKEPGDRYQSAAGLEADLRRCLTALESGREPAPFALGSNDALDRFEPAQKLYGRTAETRSLLQSFERVARGGVETILISGQAGIGKTSLVQEIYQPITRQRGYFIAGKFDQLQQNVPFSALVTALQDLVQQLLTESEEAIAVWRDAIRAAVHPNAQLIVDVVPALELIIGPQPRVAELEPLEAQNRFNLVFQSFVQVFCKRSHPLVLFLDDMQWADSASLNLVNLIAAAPATESLLIVMTYRDNEVSPTHPFMLALREQEKHGVPAHSIDLRPLGVREVAGFIADTLRQDAATAEPLAEIICQKTGGNPFFMRQFLQALHTAKLIAFDHQSKVFRYDPAAVKGAEITENVADFLAAKLRKLPADTREALRVAAVIGNRFDIGVLARAYGQSVADTAVALARRYRRRADRAAVGSRERRTRTRCNPRSSTSGSGSCTTASNRPPMRRWRRPNALRCICGSGAPRSPARLRRQIESRLFDIISHLNQGRALIEDAAERQRLAELNFRAGTKARDSTAYDLAVLSFRTAIELSGENGWRDRYAFHYDAHRRLAEASGLTADHAGAFAVIEQRSSAPRRSPIGRTLYGIKTNVLLIVGRIPEALACGREAVRLFGVDWPDDPDRVRELLQSEIRTILEQTAAIGIENLLDLPADAGSRHARVDALADVLPAGRLSKRSRVLRPALLHDGPAIAGTR